LASEILLQREEKEQIEKVSSVWSRRKHPREKISRRERAMQESLDSIYQTGMPGSRILPKGQANQATQWVILERSEQITMAEILK
jgi:hypothetical protein